MRRGFSRRAQRPFAYVHRGTAHHREPRVPLPCLLPVSGKVRTRRSGPDPHRGPGAAHQTTWEALTQSPGALVAATARDVRAVKQQPNPSYVCKAYAPHRPAASSKAYLAGSSSRTRNLSSLLSGRSRSSVKLQSESRTRCANEPPIQEVSAKDLSPSKRWSCLNMPWKAWMSLRMTATSLQAHTPTSLVDAGSWASDTPRHWRIGRGAFLTDKLGGFRRLRPHPESQCRACNTLMTDVN